MNVKRFTNSAALFLFVFGAMGLAHAQTDSPSCANKLITGTYGFTLQGNKLVGPGPTGAQIGVAMAQFDGKGNFTQIDSVTIGGEVVSDFTHTPATGTYTVNPDCTGSYTINFTDGRPTVTTDFVVVGNGDEIDAVVTSAGGNQGVLATGAVGKRRSARRQTHLIAR